MPAWELVRQTGYDLSYHAAVNYDNQAFSIGGRSGGSQVPWVIKSHDGRYGDAIIHAPANLSARDRLAACVYDERIWVSGGYNGATGIDRVSFSRDGKEWTDACLIPLHIYNHRMVSFGEPRQRLVILGGYDGTTFYNNIYRSNGDAKLEQVSVQGSQWSARSGFGCLVYKNKLWVFGGINSTDGTLDDIWYTDDLVHWHQAEDHAPWGRICDFGYCEWDERMWIIGGYESTYIRGQWVNSYKNAVWFSRDGVNWEQTFDFPETTVYHTAALPLDNRLHVFGGVGNATNVYRLILG